MRIVVSGTHASGKSTLVADFAGAHPEFEVLGDPFELIDASADEPHAETFFAQLRLAAARLIELPASTDVIAERGPIDFLAYLDALESLRRPTRSRGLLRQGVETTTDAMGHVDLLCCCPSPAATASRSPRTRTPSCAARWTPHSSSWPTTPT